MHLTMTMTLMTALSTVLIGIGNGAQPGTEWQDPAPHRATMVSAAPGVMLEVLDWEGSGRPIVLLAGLGRVEARASGADRPLDRR